MLDPSGLGRDELLDQGRRGSTSTPRSACAPAAELGIERAVVPPDFPLAYADACAPAASSSSSTPTRFAMRRRIKTDAQLDGIRRAQKAADAAMAEAASLLRALPEGLSCERVRAAMIDVCDELGCDLPPDVIVSHGAAVAVGHESGFGEIAPGEPVVVDIWPRDRRSRCWADMTRTFVAGGGAPDDELRSLLGADARLAAGGHADGARRRRLPGDLRGLLRAVRGRRAATQRTKEPGTALDRGYYHGLGHGVGLEVHERPGLGRSPDTLVAGDVITLEPGCYRPGYRRLPPGGPRGRHRRRLRALDGLSVRALSGRRSRC